MITSSTSTMHTGLRVIIAGGGIAGLSLARALKQAGHNPLVIERSTEWPTTSTAHYLPANALRALDGLGIGEQIAAAVHPISRQRVTGTGGRTLVDLPVSSVWGDPADAPPSAATACTRSFGRRLPTSRCVSERRSPLAEVINHCGSVTAALSTTTYWWAPMALTP